MHQDIYSLLIGNLWLAKPKQIEQLRKCYQLPLADISKIKNIITEVLPSNTLTNDIRTKTHEKTAQTNKQLTPPKISPKQLLINDKHTQETELSNDWQHLIELINNCENCQLAKARTNSVIGQGNRNASWFIVGESPTTSDDLSATPFSDAAGQLLDKMTTAMQLNTQELYITNVIKCKTPHHRHPQQEEINACHNYLLNQIELVKPKIILAFGRFAAQSLLNSTIALDKLRNQVHYYHGIPVIITYPPSFLLNNPNFKAHAWQDLQLALKTFSEL